MVIILFVLAHHLKYHTLIIIQTQSLHVVVIIILIVIFVIAVKDVLLDCVENLMSSLIDDIAGE